jgi:hypothetical protein
MKEMQRNVKKREECEEHEKHKKCDENAKCRKVVL